MGTNKRTNPSKSLAFNESASKSPPASPPKKKQRGRPPAMVHIALSFPLATSTEDITAAVWDAVNKGIGASRGKQQTYKKRNAPSLGLGSREMRHNYNSGTTILAYQNVASQHIRQRPKNKLFAYVVPATARAVMSVYKNLNWVEAMRFRRALMQRLTLNRKKRAYTSGYLFERSQVPGNANKSRYRLLHTGEAELNQ